MRNGKAGVSTLVAVALIVIIIAGVVFIYVSWQGLQIQQQATTQVFYGTVSVTVEEDNYLDRGASVTTASDSYIAYHTRGKTLDQATEDDFLGGNSITSGTADDVAINPEDNGHFWLKAYVGTSHYLHIQATLDANPRLVGYKYVDVDNDNRLEVVFDVDVSDIAEPDPNIKPPLDISIMVVEEDGSVSLNSPSDQSSIGTGTKTGTIEWQLSGIAEKKGQALARVYITQNRTQEDYMKVTAVEIDQVGVFSGGDITYDSGAKTWYVDIGISDYRELVEAVLLTRPSGGKSYVGITVSWETYFTQSASGYAVTVTLYVETIGADEAVDSAISDAVVLAG
jgi:hypothetical protein